MSDYAITDPEVIPFTAVVDGLPDNSVGSIGPTDVRAIYKSAVPRYFTLSVADYASGASPLWSGTTEVPVMLPDQAANKRIASNGFTLDNTGAIVYEGSVPMLATANLDVNFLCTTGTLVQIDGYHLNSLRSINEHIFSLVASTDELSASAHRMFTFMEGSTVVITRTLSGPDPDTSFTIKTWDFSFIAQPLVPATTEVRGGSYGTQNAQSAFFSEVPFTTLRPLGDFNSTFTEGTIESGVYAFAPGAEGDNTMAIAASTSWIPVTSHIVFSSVTAAADANGLGSDGDYYAFGSASDASVPVYGPKENGYWPLYPRTVAIVGFG